METIKNLSDLNLGEEIRLRSLYAIRTHDTSCLDVIPRTLEFAGMYPEVMTPFRLPNQILTEEQKRYIDQNTKIDEALKITNTFEEWFLCVTGKEPVLTRELKMKIDSYGKERTI